MLHGSELKMSTQGKEHFDQRVADVFGALDSHTPKHLSTSHKSSSDRSKEHKDLSSEKRSTHDEKDEQSHWHIQASPAGEGSPRRPRRHLETRSRPTARSPRHSRSNRVPGFLSNPEKWTRYDLKDDGSENLQGLSEDQKNTRAAFQFLEDVKERNLKHGDTVVDPEDKEGGTAGKLQFRKPRTSSNDHSHAKSTKCLSSDMEQFTSPSSSRQGTIAEHGVFRMAEYAVGSKAAPQRKQPRLHVIGEEEDEQRQTKKRKGVSTKAVVSLSHLEEDDEI